MTPKQNAQYSDPFNKSSRGIITDSVIGKKKEKKESDKIAYERFYGVLTQHSYDPHKQ